MSTVDPNQHAAAVAESMRLHGRSEAEVRRAVRDARADADRHNRQQPRKGK